MRFYNADNFTVHRYKVDTTLTEECEWFFESTLFQQQDFIPLQITINTTEFLELTIDSGSTTVSGIPMIYRRKISMMGQNQLRSDFFTLIL